MDPARPLARCDGLEVIATPDGYVVHQPARDRVHHLNPTAVLVFELCDGTTPAGEIAARVQAAWALADAPVDEVRQCLARLLDEGLVTAV
ncbi:PqqD family protein [bacterium]|nr:PqqD family protein [bacterium]